MNIILNRICGEFWRKKSREEQKGTALDWEQAATNQACDGQDKNVASILENKVKKNLTM